MTSTVDQQDRASLRKMLLPLALAQFICSFAGSNMNVMINDIKPDLNTTVQAVQVCITLFLLIMAALMIPGGKLTDKWGRKRCFMIGLTIYGLGAVISAAAPGVAVLAVGYSLFLGVGTALLIPPVYILITILFKDLKSRAWAFGVVSGMGGIGAATGPLIGGAITTGISWRAAFVFQAIIVALIVLLARGLVDPLPADPDRPFDIVGAILSASGLVILVGGYPGGRQQPRADGDPDVVGALILAGFFVWIRRAKRRARRSCFDLPVPQPHVQPRYRHPERAMGVVLGHCLRRLGVPPGGAGLQRHRDGRDLHRRDRGILVSSLAPGRLVKRFGSGLLSWHGLRHRDPGHPVPAGLCKDTPAPGLRPRAVPDGLGRRRHAHPVGEPGAIRLPEASTGRDLRTSRSVSNLGSSLGTAIAGTILVADLGSNPNRAYGIALIVLAFMGLIGLAAAIFLPRTVNRDGSGSAEFACRDCLTDWQSTPVERVDCAIGVCGGG